MLQVVLLNVAKGQLCELKHSPLGHLLQVRYYVGKYIINIINGKLPMLVSCRRGRQLVFLNLPHFVSSETVAPVSAIGSVGAALRW